MVNNGNTLIWLSPQWIRVEWRRRPRAAPVAGRRFSALRRGKMTGKCGLLIENLHAKWRTWAIFEHHTRRSKAPPAAHRNWRPPSLVVFSANANSCRSSFVKLMLLFIKVMCDVIKWRNRLHDLALIDVVFGGGGLVVVKVAEHTVLQNTPSLQKIYETKTFPNVTRNK